MAKAIAASFLVLMLAFPTVFGVDYDVGDSGGWTLGSDYSTWASGKTFKVGDTLVFKYDSSSHDVDEVDESAYNGCSSSNAIKSYNDGNSQIALSTTGKRYFLCSVPGHCSGGMKLQVNVVAANSTTPPTTPSTTPSTPSSPSGSGSPSTNATSPSPKPNGAVGVSSSIGLLVAASAVVLGFMG